MADARARMRQTGWSAIALALLVACQPTDPSRETRELPLPVPATQPQRAPDAAPDAVKPEPEPEPVVVAAPEPEAVEVEPEPEPAAAAPAAPASAAKPARPEKEAKRRPRTAAKSASDGVVLSRKKRVTLSTDSNLATLGRSESGRLGGLVGSLGGGLGAVLGGGQAAQPDSAGGVSGIGTAVPDSVNGGGAEPAEAAAPPVAAAEFPWPPPRPSAISVLPDDLLLQDGSTPQRLADVDRLLNDALRPAGYFDHSYFRIPGGFVLVTRLEQIDESGVPKPGDERWAVEVGPLRDFSLGAFLKALFTADPGLFRVIAFAVSDEDFQPRAEATTRAAATAWLSSGLNVLPREIADQPFRPSHRVTALIYEFQKPPGEEQATTRLPSELQGHTHLERAEIWQGLTQ